MRVLFGQSSILPYIMELKLSVIRLEGEKIKEVSLFVRAEQGLSYDRKFKHYLKGKADFFLELTRSNSLFISVLSQFNVQLAVNVISVKLIII